jgi:acetolactate synthase-1/3 small subunit
VSPDEPGRRAQCCARARKAGCSKRRHPFAEPGSTGRKRKGARDLSEHTISVRLENKPGALARVSQLFSRRGYNIQSLAVGPTERPDISRLTLRVDCSEHSLEQIEKQMHKLVNVLRVTELKPDESVERELALITVAAPPARRSELISLSQVAGAQVADVGRDAVTFEIVGRPEQIDAFEELVRPYGVRELARTGRIGLRRTSASRRPAPSPALA